MNVLDSIRIVLVEPTHPGNVGASARAMKNMGLERLYLVAPAKYPDPEASARAAGAEDLLNKAVVCATLDEAIGSCHFVVGTSARSRRIDWPAFDPVECAARLRHEAQRGPVAILFGQERSGLTNEALDRCHAVVQIPANPAYPSINLASAVQILSYELFRAGRTASTDEVLELPASEEEMSHFYVHLEAVLLRTGFFDPANPRLLMRRLRRLFNRAQPDKNEINILRGILTSVDHVLEKAGKK